MSFITKTENKIALEKIERIRDGEISEYLVKIVLKEKASPTVYSVIWEEEQIDIFGFWSSKASTQYNVTPDWCMRCEESALASGMPLISLYSKSNMNRTTVSVSDPVTPIKLSAGVVEETGRVKIQIDFFSQLRSPISEYEATIRIDKRNIPFYECVRDARAWWSTLGYECAYTPNHATLPMYSTWYSLHQAALTDSIIKECRAAKEYGMETVIVDDGWQTEDGLRGYAYCGDWQVAKGKIPDMRALVDAVHALGMKFMIWFSVPFVGVHSESYKKFEGKYLSIRPNMHAVLDPRFKEVREYLVETYARSVLEYGWDGLKLDFIDSFRLSETSSTEYDKMDTVSVEEGVTRLLEETISRLKEINPDIMIEFRQSYVGPAISKYGNIFRVTDCPNDAINNRVHSLNLRLTSGTTAVHSDMIMWNKNETPEAVMYQLLSVMLAVPQISVRLDEITDEHKRVLKNYLAFWREHRDTLLNGELTLEDADAGYTLAQSKKDGECVSVLYQGVVKELLTDCEYVFNSTGKDGIYLSSCCERKYEIYDVFGEKRESGVLSKGVFKADVKNCEMIKVFA